MNFNVQQSGFMGAYPSPMQQMNKLQYPQHPMQMQFTQQPMPFLQPHGGVQNLYQFGAHSAHRHKPRYQNEDGLLVSDEEEDDRLSDEDEDEDEEDEEEEDWDEEEEMQRRARASRPGSSAGFQWPWHKIPATTGYGNRGRSNSMSQHNGRNHPMEHKRASSQPPAGLGLQGVPQPFTHHGKQQQQQNMNMNMNATPFHQPMQLVQTPMAFPPQMLQFPTTPGMGAISLQNGHAVQHPHQPQVVPKKKKVEMKHKQAHHVIPNPQWAAFAAQQPVINPFAVDPRALAGVSLHPILATDCCLHFMRYDVVRGPAMMTGPGSVTQYDSQMATLPPLTHMNIHTGVHPAPFQVVNPHGITVKDVLSFLSSVLRQKFPNSAWKRMQEPERSTIGHWFYFNRSLGVLPPVEKGLLYVDMLMAKTLFAGVEMIPPKQGVTPATFVFRWASP